MVPVRAEIGTLAALAGVAYTPPPAAGAPGPDAADVEAAAGMSDADRQAMIEGMVQRLSDRLASEGGPPEDWAQLISALAVLGHKDRAAGIWAEAQTAFAGKDEALTIVREAAAKAGVGP